MPYRDEIPRDLNRWLQSRVDAFDRDFTITPVERLVRYYYYHGQPVQFRGFEPSIDIINDMHPRQVYPKRSQAALTTNMMWKAILFLEEYAFMPYVYISDEGAELSLYPTVIYTLENADKVRDFSADRLKDFIRDNPHLEGLLEEGEVDQVALKKFGRAGLYLGGRKTVSSVTTIPAQIVFADEWDRTFDPRVGEQLEARLKASPMFKVKTQRGMFIMFSTPEMENAGVTKIYDEKSDQHVFKVKCTKCNEFQEMIYPDSIANWYDKGQKPKGKIYYQCLKCHRPLDFSEIGKWRKEEPLKIHNCEWVPKRKEYYETVTRYGEGYRGRKIPWAYSQPALEVMQDRDNKSTQYFHHHVLGVPYEDKRSGLTSAIMKSISNPELKFGYEPGYTYVMGVDQGCYITIWRYIPNSRGKLMPIGKWQVVHAEFCPDELAFKTFSKGEGGLIQPKPGRLFTLMEQWKIALAVVDAEPSGNDAHNFQKDFEKKVWVNHSTRVNFDDVLLGFKWVDREVSPSGEEIWVCRISEDKTGALDAYFDFIYSGFLEVPIFEDEMETVVNHHLNIKKTTTEKNLAFGKKEYQTIYYATGFDHYGQSGKFAYQAACLYFKLDYLNPTIIIANGTISGVKFKSHEG
jgi:hypothetical protein